MHTIAAQMHTHAHTVTCTHTCPTCVELTYKKRQITPSLLTACSCNVCKKKNHMCMYVWHHAHFSVIPHLICAVHTRSPAHHSEFESGSCKFLLYCISSFISALTTSNQANPVFRIQVLIDVMLSALEIFGTAWKNYALMHNVILPCRPSFEVIAIR